MDELENKTRELNQAMDDVARDAMMLGDQFEKTAKNSEDAEKRLRDFANATRDVGRQLGRMGRDFDQQKGKMGALGSTAELAANAGAGLAKSLGVAGEVADLAAESLMAIANLTFEEVDRTIESFDKVGRVGAISAGGLEEFRTSAHRARFTVDQFSEIVAKSASSLAISTGSTLEGSRAIAELAEAAGENGLRLQLRNLGVGVEEQSEFFADYLMMQRRIGRQANRDYRSQSQAAGEYVKQLVALAGLTGKSVDEAKNALDDQMRNTRFQARIQLMAERGVDPAKLTQIQGEMIAVAERLGPVGDGIRDAFSGANTAAAAEAFATFRDVPGGLRGLIDSFSAGQLAPGEFAQTLLEAGQRTRESFGVGTLGAISGVGAGLDGLATALVNINKLSDLTPEAIARYTQSMENLAEGSNGLTNRLMESTLDLQDTAVNLESARDIFVGLGDVVLPAFTGAVESATDALDRLSKFVFELDGEKASGGPVSAGGSYLVGEEGPEIFSPGASGQITNADITSKLASIAQGSKVVGDLAGSYAYGSSPMVEGFEQTFMPGIGQVSQYTAGGITKTIIETLDGAIEEYMKVAIGGVTQEMYSAAGETYQRMTATMGDVQAQTNFIPTGPRSYYDSVMDSVRPQDLTVYKDNIYNKDTYDRAMANSARSDTDVVSGMNNVTDKISSQELVKIFSAMTAEMSKIAANTKAGADTSKQLLRSTAG